MRDVSSGPPRYDHASIQKSKVEKKQTKRPATKDNKTEDTIQTDTDPLHDRTAFYRPSLRITSIPPPQKSGDPPARVSSRGETQCRCYRNAPSAQRPLRCLCFPLDGVDSSEAKTDPTLSKKRRRPSCSPRLVFVLSERKNATQYRSENTRPKRSCVRKFGSFPYGRSTPAAKKPRRHCQRGARASWFAMIGFCSARQVDSGGAKTEPTLLK